MGISRRRFVIVGAASAGLVVVAGVGVLKFTKLFAPLPLKSGSSTPGTPNATAAATLPGSADTPYLERWKNNDKELQAAAIASAFTYEGSGMAKAPLGPLLVSATTPDMKSPFDAQNPLTRQPTDYWDALVPQNPNALTFNDPDFAEKVQILSVQGFPLSVHTATDRNGTPWLIGYVGVFDHEGLTAQEGTNPYFVPVRFTATDEPPQVGGSVNGATPGLQDATSFAVTFQDQISGKKDILFSLVLFTPNESLPPGHEGIGQTFKGQTPVVLDFLRHGGQSATANTIVQSGFNPDEIIFTRVLEIQK